MNKIKAKILNKKIRDEDEDVIVLHRLTKRDFLAKFWLLDVQAILFFYKRLFFN